MTTLTMRGNWSLDRLMMPAEVARAFQVNTKTVIRWAKAGRLAVIRTPGGHRRYSAEQVNYLLAGGSPYCDGLDRSDLSGHTITVEPLTTAMCRAAGLPVATAGQEAVVERQDGRFGKVCECDGDASLEDVARSLAHTYGARFVGGA